MNTALPHQIETLLYDEADCLDRADLEAWVGLYTGDGTYWMPAAPEQTTGDGVPSIFWEGRDLMTGEVDVVVPSGWLRAGEFSRALDYLARVVEGAEVPVKAIVEAAFFDDAALARIAREVVVPSGASFFKTGTGVYGEAFTPERIRTLRSALPEGLRLKVSGGIRDAGAALTALETGADVLGTSRTFAILGLE